MAIDQTKKQTDLERRLKILESQLYGKLEKSARLYQVKSVGQPTSKPVPRYAGAPTSLPDLSADRQDGQVSSDSPSGAAGLDVSYLRQDLVKVLILSVVALGVELLLYLGLLRNLLKLP